MGKIEFEQTLKRLASLKEPTPVSLGSSEPSKSTLDPARADALAKRALNSFKIPPKFQNSEFLVPDFLKPYQDLKKGVCLCGPAGIGKTMGLCLLARDWARQRASQGPSFEDSLKSLLFLSYPEFIMELQDSYRKESEWSALDMLRSAAKRPYLILDDLGAEKPTDYVRQATYFLINHREMHLLPTFITTNFSMGHLDKNLDPRISDRIGGMCEIIRMEGKSRRLGSG